MISICGGQNCYCLCGQRRTGGGRCDIFPRGHHHHRHHQASDLKCSFFYESPFRRALLIAQWFCWFFCLKSVVNLTLMWCPEIPLERWDRSSNAFVDTCTVYKDGKDCCWSFPSAPSPLLSSLKTQNYKNHICHCIQIPQSLWSDSLVVVRLLIRQVALHRSLRCRLIRFPNLLLLRDFWSQADNLSRCTWYIRVAEVGRLSARA